MYGISMDIGTSGIRAHAVELSSGKILSTAITESHPLPGANTTDHLTFCIKMGKDLAHEIMIRTVNQLIRELGVNLGRVERVAVCGNPTQLSIFQNMWIDDLAFVGEKAQRLRGIVPQRRNARTLPAVDVGLNLPDRVELFIPPAVKHEIGADALAMLIKSGFLEQKGNCIVTDYGTNAEMALKVGDKIYTGSAAAGPVMEGQGIKHGMLAVPGAISDMEYEFYWRCKVLDGDLRANDGDLMDLATGSLISPGKMHRKARGITGTGMIAILGAAMKANIWRKGKLRAPNGRLELQDGLYTTKSDLLETCKAIGAMRAGYFTLVEHAGINFSDLRIAYMSGAAGTYVDAVKAREIGLIPPTCDTIYQIGNTSLAMATDIVLKPELQDKLQKLADGIRHDHVMFATSGVFEQLFIQELAHWVEGMPMSQYNEILEEAGIQQLPAVSGKPKVYRTAERDIPDLGHKGLTILKEMGAELVGNFEGCNGCRKCLRECPESSMKIDDERKIYVRTKNCLGTGCYRCQFICPKSVYIYEDLKLPDQAEL